MAQNAAQQAGKDMTSDYPGWGMDGVILHDKDKGVAPECWCITREDLRFLRRQIKRAVDDGKIVPTERDDFSPEDTKIGPCMYNVVESYVKPLTKEAGGMSWALLRHPEGLQCDVFITHCWAEGAYEFIDKVLKSWPWGKKAAWCCIFANPQNLDISDLIREPRSSPFAKALGQASHMMVVPTVKTSIYSRIWCIYEAFLAVELDKVVFLAVAPLRSWILHSLAVGLAITACFAPAGYLAASYFGEGLCKVDFGEYSLPLPLVLALFSLWLSRRMKLSAIVNTLGTAALMFGTGAYIYKGIHCDTINFRVLIPMACCLYFVANEFDRLCALKARREAESLSAGYSGVHGASASNELDKLRILADIGDKSVAVDKSIHVLIDSGMSTVSLRTAAARGADLRAAADVRWGVCMIGLLVWGMAALLVSGEYFFWSIVDIITFPTIVAIWVWSERDHKAFIGTLTVKLTVLGVVMTLLVDIVWLFIYISGDDDDPDDMVIYKMFLAILCYCLETANVLTIIFAGLGRGRISQIPCIGPWLVQALGPGCGCCRKPKVPHCKHDHDDAERGHGSAKLGRQGPGEVVAKKAEADSEEDDTSSSEDPSNFDDTSVKADAIV